MTSSLPPSSRSARLPIVDVARGVALMAMVAYHLSWDLHYLGFLQADVERELGWRIFARTIAATFLFIVGVSLALANRHGFNARRFLRRLAILVASAAAVTAATLYLFPDAFIFFGILHHIALASVLGLCFVWAPPPVTFGVAALALAAPHFLTGPAFDHPALLWLGLSEVVPPTNDYVPLFPWFGVVLAGVGAGRLLPLVRPERLAMASRPASVLRWIGRHTLPVYLLHQPILFGLTYLVATILPPAPVDFSAWFSETCNVQCAESERDPAECLAICACVEPKVETAGLSGPLVSNRMTEAGQTRYSAMVDGCLSTTPRR